MQIDETKKKPRKLKTYSIFFKSCLILGIISLICLTGIATYTATYTKKRTLLQKKSDTPEVWLTVFFHGIISITPVLSFKTMHQIKHNNIKNTLYEAYVNNTRRNNFFNKNQLKQELGLKKIDRTEKNTSNACSVIANIMDLQYVWLDQPAINHYYTFGWSGLMTSEQRYQDAKEFYHLFCTEIQKFHAQGINPKIKWIGFSNGGNVCLDVAQVIQKEKLPRPFEVDELLLLGMPVRDNAHAYLSDRLFKKIYHFYSNSDRVQFLDFSQPGKFFSRRKFRAKRNQTLPNNLFQINLEILRDINLKSGWGYNKKRCNTFDQKTHISKHISRHASQIRKSSPGHCEWWFLSYTSKYYRNYFALAPFPVVAFIPTMLTNINNAVLTPNKTSKFGNQLTVILRPFEHSMTIKTKQSKKRVPFLSKEKFDLMKNTVNQYQFTKINRKTCCKYIQKELDKAKKQVAQLSHKQNKKLHAKNL